MRHAHISRGLAPDAIALRRCKQEPPIALT